MIFELSPFFGFLPLAVFIGLMLMGKSMVLAVLIAFFSGAILTGTSPVGIGEAALGGLGSFLGLIGFIIMLASGLGEILMRTKVAPNIVRLVIKIANIRTQDHAMVATLLISTGMSAMLGTMTGANALLAPILISVVAALGITKSTLGVLLHGGGAVGLMTGPFVPHMVTILNLTGLPYGEFMLTTGVPFGIMMLTTTFLVARKVQRDTVGLAEYAPDEVSSQDFEVTSSIKRGTATFLIGMVILIGYGLYIGGGATYAIFIMLVMTFLVGIATGMTPSKITEASMSGFSRLAPIFLTFSMFYPIMNFVRDMGALTALAQLLSPAIEAGGQLGLMLIITVVGIFGLSGAAVANAAVIHETFGMAAIEAGLGISVWTATLIVSSQINSFAYPGADMIAQMGLARSNDIKAMMLNGLSLVLATFVFIIIRGIILIAFG